VNDTRPPIPTLVVLGIAIAIVITAVGLRTLTSARTLAATAVTVPTEPAPTASEDGFSPWARLPDGTPLRWDACRGVELVLSLTALPSGADADVAEALDRLSRASGLELRLTGTTDERPRSDRPLVVRDGPGWRWNPVLIAWMSPTDAVVAGIPLTVHDRGLALPVSVRDGDREAYVTGQVVLNADRSDLIPGFGDRADAWGATLLHELGHLLGLAHVDDTSELMSTDPGRGPIAFGPGDRAGLAAVGAAAGCNPMPDPAAGRGLPLPQPTER
jgi:hypothetical protein